jgi:hypothetical protein
MTHPVQKISVEIKVDKSIFDPLLGRILQQKPEKTKAIKGIGKLQPKPLIPKPDSLAPR